MLVSSAVMGAVGYFLKGITANILWQFVVVFICVIVYFSTLIVFPSIRADVKEMLSKRREKEETPLHLHKTYTHPSQKEEKHSCILLLLQTLVIWKVSFDQPRQHIEKQRHFFVNKGPSSQGYSFSSGHVWM